MDRETLIKYVRQWGGVNTNGLLDKDCLIFTSPEIEGFIGYKVVSSYAIVYGNPVCSEEKIPNLANAFEQFCHQNMLKTLYTMVSLDFAKWAITNHSAIAIEFGFNLVFNPHHLPTKNIGSKGGLVRRKVKHALKEGVVVHEYIGEDRHVEEQIEYIVNSWIQNRRGFQIHLCHVTVFQDRVGKRWFYAKKDGVIVGFLVLNELKSQQGWLLNNIMFLKNAPNGISELLIISALEALDKEGCRMVLVGPIPKKDLTNMIGLNPFKTFLFRIVYKFIRNIFGLSGQEIFWDKFQVDSYEDSYLVFPHGKLGFGSIRSVIQVFNEFK
ncbi:MAG: phosphatidylglycerol lysyltransferase domain-containing protein [Parachlamydiaceae bacterium]|nr:phosphatidylglycerol lysyltransferase domain-containing protein [Parachlamydiaceae bacterium]